MTEADNAAEKAFDAYLRREYPTMEHLAFEAPPVDHFVAGYAAGRTSRDGLRKALANLLLEIDKPCEAFYAGREAIAQDDANG